MCQNCNKMCCVERFRIHMFEDRYEQFCNCEITNCESKLEMFERRLDGKRRQLSEGKSNFFINWKDLMLEWKRRKKRKRN